jgi:hypothetical protein
LPSRSVLATTAALVLLVGAACARGGSDPPDTRSNESTYGPPRVVGKIQIDELTELSGLTGSLRRPGRLWAHNDSGTEPVLFCMTLRGTSCGTTRLDGASALDWEDIASRQVGKEGILYVADIGDNERVRDHVTIYRVSEPAKGARRVETEGFDLMFPRRPFDAEAVIVEPETEDLYVITKDFAGRADVFVARGPLGSTTTLEPVGSVRLAGPLAVVTGASLAPSGDRVMLSTYAAGYELTLPPDSSFDEIWDQHPVRVDLGSHAQGEAVAYLASGDVVSGSEGGGSPIYAVKYLARQ